MTIVKIALPVPLRTLFDYLPPETGETLSPGMRVRVPFGHRELIGVIWQIEELTETSSQKLKSILTVLDEPNLITTELIQLCAWLSNYYQHPLGEVCATVLPNLLKKPLTLSAEIKQVAHNTQPAFLLNTQQQLAVDTITTSFNQFKTFLLEGVTGSGKTEVYLQIIAKLILANKQALVLVPEISLTPQTIERFEARFPGHCVAIHSGISNKKRLEAWLKAKNNQINIVIGTRSAIFTPFADLGIIIIDEEHDLSFKQQEGLRYSARDVGVMRAQWQKIPILLASATPSLETLVNVKKNRYIGLTLPYRATKATLPTYQIIDLRNQYLESGISPTLLAKIKLHLAQNKQILLFLNRRGFAPVLLCHQCGWTGKCSRCDINFTYYQTENKLVCHHCQKTLRHLKICPDCKQSNLQAIGVGTQRLEQELAKLFPETKISRIDRDNIKKKGQLQALLAEINQGEPHILIGTQMLAKGHHFPNITLVGIINSDYGFFSSDFRAMERMGQLITQVAGRAGRADHPGEVMIQTHQPEHPLLQKLLQQGYHAFAEELLTEREMSHLPPFRYFVLLRAQANQAEKALAFFDRVKEMLLSQKAAVDIYGPIPSPLPKRAGQFRSQLLLSSAQRKSLHQLLQDTLKFIQTDKLARSVRWSVDIDPQEMF